MATMNVSVPDPMRDWIQRRIDAGDYANVSDYVQELVQRDRDEANGREALVEALKQGETSGLSPRQLPEIFAAVRGGNAQKQGG